MDKPFLNRKGGLVPRNRAELKRAKDSSLVTLPVEINGANCFSCRFSVNYDNVDKKCLHPRVNQLVNDRMLCSLWDAVGVVKPWKIERVK